MNAEDQQLLAAMQPKAAGLYQAYNPIVTVEQARAMFQAKYGHTPKSVIVTGGAVMAGPICTSEATK